MAVRAGELGNIGLLKTPKNLSTEVAVLVSLVLHGLAFTGWQNRAVLGRLALFRPLAKIFAGAPARPQPVPAAPTITFVQEPAPQRAEDRRQFIETDASQVTGEEPKNARFYSANSTVAANPDNPSGKMGDAPYLDGNETRLASTENVRPQPGAAVAPVPQPITPPATPPVAPPSDAAKPAEPGIKAVEKEPVAMLEKPVTPSPVALKPPEPAAKLAETGLKAVEEQPLANLEKPVPPPPVVPKPPLPVTKLAETGLKISEEQPVAMLAKPAAPPAAALPPPPQPASPPPVPVLPTGSGSGREIAAAKSHATAMGVSRIGIAAFNVAGSPFGEYDKALIFAVQSRWYAVLNEKRMDVHAGTVVLLFDLRADGSVTNMAIKENSAGFDLGLYCEKAVVESAPFAPLPESLQRLIGSDTREIIFTFYY